VDERERRLAKNEVFFRESNELVARGLATKGFARADFICECSKLGCVERVPITLDDYRRVRELGVRFVVIPGHEDLTLEVVVERNAGYVVVEKVGDAAEVARETDLR